MGNRGCILLIASIFFIMNSNAQNVGIGTTTPNSSAQLDVSSTAKGFLTPRMSATQRTGIPSPAAGLLVYDTDSSSFAYYTGSNWFFLKGASSLANTWSTVGNSGTASYNFIGTTDNNPLRIRINNRPAGMIDASNKSIGFGDSALYSNTGYSNIAIGTGALVKNTGTDRSNLVAIGDSALYHNGAGATQPYHGIQNTAVGSKVLYSNTLGHNNTAYGFTALYSNTLGISNIAIGSGALYNNIAGSSNTAVGDAALSSNTNGSYNTALGNAALTLNVTGYENTAVGNAAMVGNTTGHSNTASGFQSLYSNTTGNYNTSNGDQALLFNTTGNGNTANGSSALYSNTTAFYNTAIGYQSLYSNTNGGENTATGYGSLYSNTTGYSNTANGRGSLYNNIDGNGNTANGYSALYSNTSGYYNTANGFTSLLLNTTGYYNTAYGINSLYSNSTGHHNVAVGNASLYTNADGNYNTAIGAYADVSASYLGDATAIGANAIANGYDKVVIGGPYSGTIVIGGYANWSNFSDGRFKENILEDVPGLSFISKLRPVTYQINTQMLVNHITHLMPDSIASRYKKTNTEYAAMHQKRFTGFVAQEVEQAAKELGYDFDGVNSPRNETDHYSISYASFVIPLVKAVQEQQQQIELLKKQNEILSKRLEALEDKNK
jgi:hypothetical protein